MKQRIFTLLLAGALVVSLAACSSSGRDNYGAVTSADAPPMDSYDYMAGGYDDSMTVREEMAFVGEADVMVDPVNPTTGGGMEMGGAGVEMTQEEQKIILNMDLNLQTRDFDDGVAKIEQLARDFDGFIQNAYVQGNNLYNEYGSRYANYTLRLPVGELDTFVEELSASFNVTSVNRYQDNITAQYYDTDARLRSLRIQEERLLEMLEQAEELQYLLEIQRELYYIQYQIESFQTALNRMDSQVSYSTVTLYLEEVVEYDRYSTMPTSFGEEIGNSFRYAGARFVRFCKDIVLVAIESLPFLCILAVVIIVIVLLWRRRRKKKKAAAAARVTAITPPENSDDGES